MPPARLRHSWRPSSHHGDVRFLPLVIKDTGVLLVLCKGSRSVFMKGRRWVRERPALSPLCPRPSQCAPETSAADSGPSWPESWGPWSLQIRGPWSPQTWGPWSLQTRGPWSCRLSSVSLVVPGLAHVGDVRTEVCGACCFLI